MSEQQQKKSSRWEVVSDDKLTYEEWLKLFKCKERQLFIRYLAEKKLAMVVERGQAPSAEAEYRAGGIEAVQTIMRDMGNLDTLVKLHFAREAERSRMESEMPLTDKAEEGITKS